LNFSAIVFRYSFDEFVKFETIPNNQKSACGFNHINIYFLS